jgi:hypothetical protein
MMMSSLEMVLRMKVRSSTAFPENVGYRSGRLLGRLRIVLSERKELKC